VGKISKITVHIFGNIHENANGALEFSGFHVDGNGTNKSTSEVLLQAVIERIQLELDEITSCGDRK
jgi:hypothetical protein